LTLSCEGRSSLACSCSLLMSIWIACYLPIGLSTTPALKIGYEELVLGLGESLARLRSVPTTAALFV
jgi:hypothetical protein